MGGDRTFDENTIPEDKRDPGSNRIPNGDRIPVGDKVPDGDGIPDAVRPPDAGMAPAEETVRDAPIVRASNLVKHYRRGRETVKALDGVTLSIRPGEMLAIVGPSGSGKTTLMNLISCLDTPTSGALTVGGTEVSHLNEGRLIGIRRSTIGFIFQQFCLIPTLTASENVGLPLLFTGEHADPDRIGELLTAVGLGGRGGIPVHRLSGGDKQRVAIARALVNEPKLLIADEPTGKLETAVRDRLVAIFRDLASRGIAVFIATHDLELAERTDRIIHLQDGRIVPKEASSLYR
jgi:putative ABC transport system ATP-binding protein